MYTAKVININEFKQSKEVWNKLALEMNIPSIFCTWEWIYTWWEHYGSSYEPLILSILDGLEIKGFLPLARARSNNAIKSKALIYCGSSELYPDHLDIICARGDAEQCVISVIKFLTRDCQDWDVLKVSLLAEGSNLLNRINVDSSELVAEVTPVSTAPFIRLSGSFDDYNKRFNSKKRYNIKRGLKKLSEDLGMRYTVCGRDDVGSAIENLFRLHALRAEMKNIKSSFDRPDIQKFHHILAERISGNGWLCLRSLSNGTETIASIYCFIFGGRLFYYQIGFDPKWERYSPGTVLIYQALEEAFSQGCKEFDFLRGGEEYKSTWADENRRLFSINLYNNSLKGSVTKVLTRSKGLIKNRIKRFID